MKVLRLLLDIEKKGSRTGNFFEPQRTVCSKIWATPLEVFGLVCKERLNRFSSSSVCRCMILAPVFSWINSIKVALISGISTSQTREKWGYFGLFIPAALNK